MIILGYLLEITPSPKKEYQGLDTPFVTSSNYFTLFAGNDAESKK